MPYILKKDVLEIIDWLETCGKTANYEADS